MMNSSPFDPATEKYVSLATYRRNGVEVKMPVWIAKVAERYYVFSAGLVTIFFRMMGAGHPCAAR